MCKVREFDEFFVKEYDYLVQFSRSIDPQSDFEGLLHDCYIRCKDRITVNGYSGLTFMNYMRVTLQNQYKSNYRLLQKRPQVNFDNENYYHTIEVNLQYKNDQEQQEKELQDKVSYVNTMVWSYISEHFNQKEQFVFRTYFLLKPKRINYKQLSEATGYSITTVSNIIKRMKIDIKLNLESYINGTIITGHTVTT